MPDKPSRLKETAFTIVAVVLCAIFLEGSARIVEVVFPSVEADLGLGFTRESRLFASKPGHLGVLVTSPAKSRSFGRQEITRRKGRRVLRVAALGGSSVAKADGPFRRMTDRLAAAMPERYDRGEFINAGGLSYGSHRLVGLAAEIVDLDPDLIIVYSGHNEFEELEQLELASLETIRLQRALSRSALYRLMRDLLVPLRVYALWRERQNLVLATNYPAITRSWSHDFTPKEVAARMEAYEENLRKVIWLARSRNILVVIGTVPSNIFRPALSAEDLKAYAPVLALLDKGDYLEGYRMGRRLLVQMRRRHQSSDLENGIIRSLARELDVPLADVEAAVVEAEPHRVPGETLFQDHCHLNDAGDEIMVGRVARTALEVLKGPPAAAVPK